METNKVCHLLKTEFLERCKKNPQYSVRAYAKYLNVDHSQLAKIIRGQMKLSQQMAMRIADKLGLTTAKVQELLTFSQDEMRPATIAEDIFVCMSDWYHFAILELVKTDSFIPSVEFISNALSISRTEADMALERLERLEFIKLQDGDIILNRSNNHWFNHESSSEARKNLQKQLLQKALVSIDEVKFEDRINSTLTIAIDESKLDEFRELTQNFVNMCDEKSLNSKMNQVYQLCVAFYPLT